MKFLLPFLDYSFPLNDIEVIELKVVKLPWWNVFVVLDSVRIPDYVVVLVFLLLLLKIYLICLKVSQEFDLLGS